MIKLIKKKYIQSIKKVKNVCQWMGKLVSGRDIPLHLSPLFSAKFAESFDVGRLAECATNASQVRAQRRGQGCPRSTSERGCFCVGKIVVDSSLGGGIYRQTQHVTE